MAMMASCESLDIFTIYLSFDYLDSGSSEYFILALSLNIEDWTQSIQHDLNFYLFRWILGQATKAQNFSVHRIITFSYVYRLLSFILLSRNLCEQWKSLMACWLDIRLCVSWSLFSLQILFLSIGHIAAETYVHMKFPKDRSTSIIIARSSLNF